MEGYSVWEVTDGEGDIGGAEVMGQCTEWSSERKTFIYVQSLMLKIFYR